MVRGWPVRAELGIKSSWRRRRTWTLRSAILTRSNPFSRCRSTCPRPCKPSTYSSFSSTSSSRRLIPPLRPRIIAAISLCDKHTPGKFSRYGRDSRRRLRRCMRCAATNRLLAIRLHLQRVGYPYAVWPGFPVRVPTRIRVHTRYPWTVDRWISAPRSPDYHTR